MRPTIVCLVAVVLVMSSRVSAQEQLATYVTTVGADTTMVEQVSETRSALMGDLWQLKSRIHTHYVVHFGPAGEVLSAHVTDQSVPGVSDLSVFWMPGSVVARGHINGDDLDASFGALQAPVPMIGVSAALSARLAAAAGALQPGDSASVPIFQLRQATVGRTVIRRVRPDSVQVGPFRFAFFNGRIVVAGLTSEQSARVVRLLAPRWSLERLLRSWAPCSNDFTCSTGRAVVVNTEGFRIAARAVVVDSGTSVRSDGHGAYVHGVDHTFVSLSGAASVETRDQRQRPSPTPTRALVFDLSHPVPDQGGTSMGVIADSAGEIHAGWQILPGCSWNALGNLPVGQTVPANFGGFTFHKNGRVYWLMTGFSLNTDCVRESRSVATRLDAPISLTLSRQADSVWVLNAPAGSIGRVYDVTLTDQYAVDMGLYYFSMRVIFSPIGAQSTTGSRMPPANVR